MKEKIQVCVVWQSLVVDSYRSFFYHLEEINPNISVHLIAPDFFEELGSQKISCAPFPSEKIQSAILPVWSPHTQIVWFRGLIKEFKKRLKNSKTTPIILCFGEPYSPTSLGIFLAAKIALGSNFFFVSFTCQNIFKKFSFPLNFIQKFIFQQASAVLSVGKEQSEVLQNQGYKGEIISFPLWYDSEKFKILNKIDCYQILSKYCKKSLSPSSQKITLGYLGSLSEAKGILDLLDCLKKFSGLFKDKFKIFFAGAGPLVPTLTSSIENLTSLDLEASYLGPLPASHTPSFLNVIDILIVPSKTQTNWKEQFGRVIVEAFACGTLPIGSSSGEISRVIGKDSLIFPEGDIDKMKDTLLAASKFLTDKETCFQFISEQKQKYADRTLAKNFSYLLESGLIKNRKERFDHLLSY